MKKSSKQYLAIVVIFISMLASLFIFSSMVKNKFIDFVTVTMDEVAEQQIIAFKDNLDRAQKLMIYYAHRLENVDEYNEELIANELAEMTQDDIFDRVLLVNTKGLGIASDSDNTMNIEDTQYFKSAMEGNTYVSEKYISGKDNESYMVISTPIYGDKNNVTGVLVSESKLSSLSVLLKPSFQNVGRSYVISKGGEVIAKSENSTFPLSENILDYIFKQKHISNDSTSTMYAKIQTNQGGLAEYRIKEEDTFIRYEAVGMNDWYYLLVVDYVHLMSGLNTLFIGMILLLGVIIAAFSFLFFNIQKGVKDLQLSQLELEKEKENTTILIDSMPVSSFLWEEGKGITYCNNEAFEMFGLENRKDFLQVYNKAKLEFQPDGLKTAEIEKELIKKTSALGYIRRELVYQNIANGNHIPCEVTMVKVKHIDKFVIAIYLRDLSETRAMLEALEKQQQMALEKENSEKSIKAKMQFLANMSHEIRTPMNAIVGMTELLINSELDENQKSYIKDIQISSETLLNIINEILDFSKLESGKMELVLKHYDFISFLDHIKSMSRHMMKGKQLDFDFEIQGEMPLYLYGDSTRLKQVLWNVIGNAGKYTKKGFVKIKVKKQGQFLKFDITDSGIGIRDEDIPALFDPFTQFDRHKNSSIVGTGLGLNIVKGYIDLMNGKLEVSSVYGEGSTFSIIIPIVLGDKDLVEVEEVDLNTNIISSSAKILVIDDNEINLHVAKGLFGLFNIDIYLASGGAEGIKLLQEQDFDMVFMDHMMPEMNGIEATHRIRELGTKYEQLPIVALTANAIKGAKEMFLREGLNDFISKPINKNELKRIIIKWVSPDKIVLQNNESTIIDVEDEKIEKLRDLTEFNVDLGIERGGGSQDIFLSSLQLFSIRLKDYIEKARQFLLLDSLEEYVIVVHGLKGVLATLGAEELSKKASELEAFGKLGDIDYCRANTEEFLVKLMELQEKINMVFEDPKDLKEPKLDYNKESVDILVKDITEKIEDFDRENSLSILEEIFRYNLDEALYNNFKSIESFLMAFDFDSSLDIIEGIEI